MNDRLFRSREDRMLAGVAGGLAELWDADPSLVRIGWALLVVFTGGIALIVYIVMAIVVPEGELEPWPVGVPPTGEPLAADAATPGQPMTATATGAEGTAALTAGAAPTTGWVQPTPRSSRRAARAARRAERRANGGAGTAGLIAGGFLLLLGVFFLVREWMPQIDFDWFWPAMLVALGVIVLLTALGRGRDTAGPSGGAS